MPHRKHVLLGNTDDELDTACVMRLEGRGYTVGPPSHWFKPREFFAWADVSRRHFDRLIKGRWKNTVETMRGPCGRLLAVRARAGFRPLRSGESGHDAANNMAMRPS